MKNKQFNKPYTCMETYKNSKTEISTDRNTPKLSMNLYDLLNGFFKVCVSNLKKMSKMDFSNFNLFVQSTKLLDAIC